MINVCCYVTNLASKTLSSKAFSAYIGKKLLRKKISFRGKKKYVTVGVTLSEYLNFFFNGSENLKKNSATKKKITLNERGKGIMIIFLFDILNPFVFGSFPIVVCYRK